MWLISQCPKDVPRDVLPHRQQRNQSQITRKWWGDKRRKQEDLQEENKSLSGEVAHLREEKEQLQAEIAAIEQRKADDEAMLINNQQQSSEVTPLLKEADKFGGFNKSNDKDGRVFAVGRSLLSLLGVIMKGSHPITRMHAVCRALFG
jgi:hypothetical protein